MYFSIPDTTEVSAKSSSNQQAHTLFNIHINGIHFCSLRYSHLHTFNEELHRLLPRAMVNIESFPPKKLFSLSIKETEERRVLLEHYLQSLTQNKYIITSSYFNEFFLNAQRETFTSKVMDYPEKINFKVYLLNNHELNIENLSSNTNTSNLFDACAVETKLQQDSLTYFSLYLYSQKDNQLNILRQLYDFESPYFSLQQTNKIYEQTCIVLKKSYWDFSLDLPLINDRRACKLLFVQAQYEIEQSQLFYPSEIYRQLDVLREKKSFKDYVLLARTSKFYGHIFVRQCSILYPINDVTQQKLCQCLLAIGNNEILCCINVDEKKKMEEVSFKVTRIRCWKVNRTQQETNIALEYLIRKNKIDTLEWITIHTEQAPFVSTCLQSMVDEILAKKTGTTDSSPSVTVTSTAGQTSMKIFNGLATRIDSDLKQLNDDALGDEDL